MSGTHQPGRLSYLERKLAQLCTYPGCSSEPADDNLMCPAHRDAKRARASKSARRVRRRRKREACCGSCGTQWPKIWPRRWGCPVCKIKRNRVPRRSGADNNADKSGQWRRDSSGWERYRGRGRRGAPTLAETMAHAIAMSSDQWSRGGAAALYAVGEDVASLPPIQREATREAAAHELELAARAISEAADLLRGKARTDDDLEGFEYPRMSASAIATAAEVGAMIYAPPPESHRTDSDDEETSRARAARPAPKPPDMAPLRAALAARGLGLVAEGAFWWKITKEKR